MRNAFLSPTCFRKPAGGGFVSEWKKISHKHIPMRKDTETSSHPLPSAEEQEQEGVLTLQHPKGGLRTHVWQLIPKQPAGESWLTFQAPLGTSSLKKRGTKLAGWPGAHSRTVRVSWPRMVPELQQSSPHILTDMVRSLNAYQRHKDAFSPPIIFFKGHSFINMKYATSLASASLSFFMYI